MEVVQVHRLYALSATPPNNQLRTEYTYVYTKPLERFLDRLLDILCRTVHGAIGFTNDTELGRKEDILALSGLLKPGR
jgi:hypothetical protein